MSYYAGAEVLRNFELYCSELLKIKTNMLGPDGRTDERIIPFFFNHTQAKLNRIWERQLSQNGLIRLIILKARREGISTYTEARLFHKIHTTPNTNAFIIAHDKKSTATIFDMTKLFYESLPKAYKPMKRYSSRKELVLENPDDKTRRTNPGLRSGIDVFTANKITSTRSGGYSCAHFSEVAHYLDAQLLISATAPTIPDSEGSIVVYESTAFGKGGFFYEEWNKAVRSLRTGKKYSNFYPVFFSWLEFEAYRKPFTDGCDRRELLDTLDPEEKELLAKHKATPEQLHWRRHKLLDVGDLNLFHQEYPTTPEEAFISSGQCYFNRDKLRHISQFTDEPIKVGDITYHGFIENPEGPLSIWKPPQPGSQYVIGIDVGSGLETGDYSVMEVVQVPRGSPVIEQVAEWAGHLDPVMLAQRAIALARYYNEALLAPEVNNHGQTTLNEIKANYWNIYRWQYFDRFGKHLSQKLGWECVTPETRVLTSDMHWTKAKEISSGDSLLAFSKEVLLFPSVSQPLPRRLRHATVTAVKRFVAPLVRLGLRNGNEITVSSNHPFLCYEPNRERWVEARNLRPGMQIRSFDANAKRETPYSDDCVEVSEIQPAQEGEVIGLETSEGTFIAEGLLSHNTNIATRPLLCDYCSACLNADILHIHSKDLISEMFSFIRRPTTGGEADAGCYDDRVMAFMIAIFCMAHDYQSSSVLQELGLSPNPIITETKKPQIYIPYAQDVELVGTGFFDTQERNSWMAY